MNYKQAREDFEALERIVELSDQGPLDEDRQGLMQNPTRAYAASIYESGIRLWFKEHGIDMIASENEVAAKIKTRYRI